MNTYEVNVVTNATYAYIVEAENSLEAREMAMLAFAGDEPSGYLVSESTFAFVNDDDTCDGCCHDCFECDEDGDDDDDDEKIEISEEDGKKIEEAFNVLKMMEEKYGI